MKLIDNWQSALHLNSVQVAAVGSVATSVWILIPDDMKVQLLNVVGVKGPAIAVLIGFVSAIVARLRKQSQPC